MKNWFEIDKQGLAKILERKGKEFVVFELLQNCWDEPGVKAFDGFLESIHAIRRAHWDHEPTPNPSQEGN